MKSIFPLIISSLVLVGCDDKPDVSQSDTPRASGTTTNDRGSRPTTQPDNTAVNTRDQSSGAITAGSQGQGKSDVDITADIRRRVMKAEMSVNAQNAKIICEGGKVTLRGPVNSQAEKDSIGRMAADVVGAASVTNELEVKPNG